MSANTKTAKNASKVSSRKHLERRVPKLRFPGFEGEWEECSLEKCCRCFDNKRKPISAELREKGKIPYYGANGIQDYVKDFIFEGEFVLLAEDGGHFDEYSNKPIAQYITGKSWVNNHAHVLNGKDGYSTRYLYFSLVHKDIRKYINGTSRAKLNQEDMWDIKIHVPENTLQEKISTFLSFIEERIAAQRRLVELLKKHKQGLLQSLFVNKNGKIKLRFNEFKDSWREYQISDLFEVTRGYVLPTKETKNERDEKYRFPVYSSQTKDEGLMGYYFKFLYENAITWTTDGANAGTVHYRHGPFYCTNVCGVLLNDSGYANKCIGEILNSVAKHYVSYVGNPKLMNNVMSEIRITIPSIREQQKIATLLTWIDSRISQSEKALIKTESIKNGLLQQLFV